MSEALSPVTQLTGELISRRSVTPTDEGCQDIIGDRLKKLGFTLESMFFEDTLNLWARKGDQDPVFCFAGHTDVVPTGPEENWTYPPFTPTIVGDTLYGRGAADMKGSLAAMVVATERFIAENPDHKGSIAFLITSDEEGPFINGTVRVMDTLMQRDEKITWCVVGEPSSTATVGDVIKVGRRGSLSGNLTIKGIQGHVAYPQLAKNPYHESALALAELVQIEWDQGNEFFPPTSFQISNINGGTGATNVIPGSLNVLFNLRYSTETTAENIINTIEQHLDSHQLDYSIDWTFNGLPFLTEHGELLDAAVDAVSSVTDTQPELLTTGGTSDGRFIAPTGAKVIELGPVNASIHKVDEHVSVSDLDKLSEMYLNILRNLLAAD